MRSILSLFVSQLLSDITRLWSISDNVLKWRFSWKLWHYQVPLNKSKPKKRWIAVKTWLSDPWVPFFAIFHETKKLIILWEYLPWCLKTQSLINALAEKHLVRLYVLCALIHRNLNWKWWSQKRQFTCWGATVDFSDDPQNDQKLHGFTSFGRTDSSIWSSLLRRYSGKAFSTSNVRSIYGKETIDYIKISHRSKPEEWRVSESNILHTITYILRSMMAAVIT